MATTRKTPLVSPSEISQTATILQERLGTKRQDVAEKRRPIMFISHTLGAAAEKARLR